MRLIKILFLILAVRPSIAAWVDLKFKVLDDSGNPVPKARIQISAERKFSLPIPNSRYKSMSCSSDSNGDASESFFYWGGEFFCSVEKDGHYSEWLHDEFKTSYDRRSDKVTYLEKEKEITVVLRRRSNPIPLYVHSCDFEYLSFGRKESHVAYDLKIGDFLPPRGKGEVPDLYLHHRFESIDGTNRCTSIMTFPEGAGAYIVKGNPNASHPIVHCADTNRVYETSFVCVWTSDPSERKIIVEGELLNEHETLVIRSRVEKDEDGNIVKANYSKIYGPFQIARVFKFKQSCFNPTINDPNLEFDVDRNLTGKRLTSAWP